MLALRLDCSTAALAALPAVHVVLTAILRLNLLKLFYKQYFIVVSKQ